MYQRSHGSTTSGNKPETMRAHINKSEERKPSNIKQQSNLRRQNEKEEKTTKKQLKNQKAGEKVPSQSLYILDAFAVPVVTN